MRHNEIVYQVFPRNYAQEEPFKSIANDLDRIKDLGVDIVYLLPIHIIGEKARKGTYGSPYSIRDYFSISPDLGSKEDLINLINKTHEKGMKIILDMVFNHTSLDNVLLKDHEDYYFHKNGKLSNRVGDWTDIIDLDTFKEETQDYLISVLKYWISLGVDGFRFDVASMIPLSLFIKARKELGKEVIFIAESIEKEFALHLINSGDYATPDEDMYPTFDSLYNYNWFTNFGRYIKGTEPIDILIERLNEDDAHQRLLTLENHDLPRVRSYFGNDKLKCWLELLAFIKGQIFIYAGQEYGNTHRPELFEKDVVDFSHKDLETLTLYKNLINSKKKQKEIVHQSFEKIDEHHVLVKVEYADGEKEEKEFYLPQM